MVGVGVLGRSSIVAGTIMISYGSKALVFCTHTVNFIVRGRKQSITLAVSAVSLIGITTVVWHGDLESKRRR